MSTTKLSGVRFAGVAACVPEARFDNRTNPSAFDKAEVEKFINMSGVLERRITGKNICGSDLCLDAGRNLLKSLNWSPESVDVLIYVTQTPDYFQPGNASLLHRDLQLSDNCAAFDISLGCSGYPYGIWIGAQMIQSNTAKRVLVLHAETPTKVNHPEDRATFLLFGDAGSATGLEADGASGEWGFVMQSDGTGYKDLIVPGGGFRDKAPEDQRDLYVFMNGANIFNFTLKRVPKLINDTLALCGIGKEDIDVFVFHQANKFILLHLLKKMGISKEKVPLTIEKYGNTGGASVPLTLTMYGRENPITEVKKVLLLGFGIGLSWGSAFINLDPDAKFLYSEVNAPCLSSAESWVV